MSATNATRVVRAFAPGTVANLGPGLDVLGLAVAGVGDTVTAERTSDREIRILSSGHPEISADPPRNTAGIAASLVRERAGGSSIGIALAIEKGLPLAGGQGGSAASAVAAAVAVNALLGNALSSQELLEPCLEAEAAVAGRHADNVGAALFGGVVLVESLDPPAVVRLAYPRELLVVMVEPRQTLRTEEARSRLPRAVDLSLAVAQAARVGALVSALASGDWELLRRSVEDGVAEPARAPLLPGFLEAKRRALAAGAFGCSISGSGPTAFAFSRDPTSARRVGGEMVAAYRSVGVEATARVCEIDDEGARVLGNSA
jgi:homoserine kinase